MRVLIVEDNETLTDALSRGLGAEGFEVDVCHDGTDGLWRAQEFPYDVIVLDVMVPGVNGYQICRTLRSEGSVVPILMLTAKSGEYDIAEGLDLGADDYMVKPFSFVELSARLRALGRRRLPSLDPEITVGAVTIDTNRRTCSVDGVPIKLGPREFAILELLSRQPSTPVRRAEIADRVWGADHEAESNVIDVHIATLRRKLGSHRSLIETVRGVGYRLVRE